MPTTFDATFLVVTVLLTLRISIIAALLPLISGRTVPIVWRLTLSGVIAAAAAPVIIQTMPPGAIVMTWETQLLEAANSALVGMMVAFVVSIPFAAVRFAGQIIGVQIGFSMVNTIDPQSGMQASVLAQLYYLLAVILFFTLDLHHLLIRTLVETCYVAPLFGAVDARAGAWLIVSQAIELMMAIFRMFLTISKPDFLEKICFMPETGFILFQRKFMVETFTFQPTCRTLAAKPATRTVNMIGARALMMTIRFDDAISTRA